MKKSDVERLLQQPEGQFLERKSCYEFVSGKWKRRKPRAVAKDIAETLSAFANADGGTLLLGVDDDGRVSGVDYPEDKLKVIKEAPRNLIRPASPEISSLPTEIKRFNFSGKQIFVLRVHWVLGTYRLTDGRYLMRIGDSNMPFPADQIDLLKAGKRRAVFEGQIVLSASWNDISEERISDFGKRVGLDDSPEEILRDYRLIDYDDGNPRFKLAALLLFGKDPLKWHPRCGIDFIKYEGTERKTGRELNIIKRARLECPLVLLIDEAYRTISAHVKERQYLHDLFFAERMEYPTFAWQEAIVNAVAHRDYSIQGLSIEIWMFDDRIEIRSPGLPPEPVTLEKILKRERVHASRNPLIVRVLTDLGYMRETGEGIPRMFDEMEKNGLYPPQIGIVADSIFSVSLKNQPVFTPSDMEWLGQFERLGLNPDQKRMLLFARSHDGTFTNRDWQRICDTDIYSASRGIRWMIRKGCLEHLGKRSRIYRIVLPAMRKRGFPEDYKPLEKVLESQGYITNRDIQEILRVSRFQAVRIARTLVDQGFVELIGKGRGSKYVKKAKTEIEAV